MESLEPFLSVHRFNHSALQQLNRIPIYSTIQLFNFFIRTFTSGHLPHNRLLHNAIAAALPRGKKIPLRNGASAPHRYMPVTQ
jgi:hypothetical protein